MLKTIYIIRHGETDWNKEGKLQGWTDTHLNKEGIRQAEEIARWFQDKHIDSLYSSDLFRTWETAAFIGKQKELPITKSYLLRGRNFGQMAGMTWDEIKQKRPDIYKYLIDESQVRWSASGIETILSLQERIRRFFNSIRPEEKEFCIVAHGATLRQMLKFFSCIDSTQRPIISNASITTIKHEGGRFSHQTIDIS